MKYIVSFPLLALSFCLSGCDAIGNFADRVGSHMPVVGERCEHWQCMTESGRQVSAINKRNREMQEEKARAAAQADAGANVGAQAPTPASTPSGPLPPDRKPVPQRVQ